ncbi:hypothetical protein Taro_050916 [Colocasia esculenta]|uniref:Pentatricopeptide repeat-containing protein n=1 Tax=Colocasia esculenta TaxID=4460 RepID=A0A843XF89_COLES|nr:hypothetical protein [Colocasia esculenta]
MRPRRPRRERQDSPARPPRPYSSLTALTLLCVPSLPGCGGLRPPPPVAVPLWQPERRRNPAKPVPLLQRTSPERTNSSAEKNPGAPALLAHSLGLASHFSHGQPPAAARARLPLAHGQPLADRAPSTRQPASTRRSASSGPCARRLPQQKCLCRKCCQRPDLVCSTENPRGLEGNAGVLKTLRASNFYGRRGQQLIPWDVLVLLRHLSVRSIKFPIEIDGLMAMRTFLRNLYFAPHPFFRNVLPYDSFLCTMSKAFSSQQSFGFVDPEPSVVEDVNDICRILSDYRGPHHDIESALCGFSGKVSVDVVEQVLKRCKNLGVSAHRFFLWSGKLPGFTHSRTSYHILVDILGSCKEFPLIWDFLFEMRDSNYEICPEIFWIIFRSYCRANLPADAVRAFKKMEEFGIKPSIDDFHQLLTNLCLNNFMKEAQEIFEKWKSDFDVNPKTYSILMKGWGDFGNSDGARELFIDMLKRCSPDVIAYNTLMGCLCRAGRVDEAYEVFREMKHHEFQPDAASYGVFIRASCEANDVHSALKILERTKRYNLVPNVFTYNCIIKLFCKSGKLDEAYELLDEMLERGAKPDPWSYNTILAVHCRLHEVNKALRLLSRMDRDSCLPDKHTYNMLLKMLIGIGRIDRAMEVWDGMGGRGFYPSVSTYAVMIHGLCKKKGRLEDACRYFEMMIDEGLPPYLNTCELLRNCLLLLGLRERVHILAVKMQQSTSCKIQELSDAMLNRLTRKTMKIDVED